MTATNAATASGPAHASSNPIRTLERAIVALWRDLAEIEFSGARAGAASSAALAVAISVGAACALHLPDPWWAAISGFISTQATRPASIQKGSLRIAGTAAGAAASVVLLGRLVYDEAACCVALLAISFIGILGLNVSRHGYAYLFFSITFALVLLMSLTNPLGGFDFAVYRTIEVVIGTASAIVVAIALEPAGSTAAAPTPAPRDLLGADWPIVLHALRSGIAVAVIPLTWSVFYLPSVTTTATTMASVLAVPVLADHPLHDRMMVERAFHRLLGCFVGGGTGLSLLAIPLTQFAPWLIALAAGTWLFAYVQGSARGIGYLGTQAAVAFMMTLVQGEGPPDSILPGLNRIAGIVVGMTTLFLICVLLEPLVTPEPIEADGRAEARP